MNRGNSSGRRRIYGLLLASVLVPAVALAGGAPGTVESGTGAANARNVGRITIGGVASNINVRSFRLGAASPGSSSGGAIGKPVFSDLYVVKAVDSSSPNLMLRLALGNVSPTVTVEIFTPGTTTVAATYELTDARIMGLTDADPGRSASSGGQNLEEVGFGFRRLTVTVGGVARCYDTVTGTSC